MIQRVALYFSGRIRTYEQQISTLKNLSEKYNMDVFVSLNGELDDYHRIFLDTFDIKKYNFEIFHLDEPFKNLRGYRDGNSPYNMTSAFYNNMKAFEMIEEYQNQHGFVYDVVVKYRADVVSNEDLNLLNMDMGSLYIPEGRDYTVHSKYKGMNDQIAYGDPEMMKIYSSLYRNMEEYLIKDNVIFHPESLLYHHLKKNDIIDRIKRFPFDYSLNKKRSV